MMVCQESLRVLCSQINKHGIEATLGRLDEIADQKTILRAFALSYFPTSDLSLSIDEFDKRHLLPAIEGLVAKMNTASAKNIVFYELEMVAGPSWSERSSSYELGASIRVIRAYDIREDAFATRFDVLYSLGA